MGSSFSHGIPNAIVAENTIASFERAFCHGVDMIEFDVMLTKDMVPIIYHDFATFVSAARHSGSNGSNVLVKIPVQDLTLNELTNLNVESLAEWQYKAGAGKADLEVRNKCRHDSGLGKEITQAVASTMANDTANDKKSYGFSFTVRDDSNLQHVADAEKNFDIDKDFRLQLSAGSGKTFGRDETKSKSVDYCKSERPFPTLSECFSSLDPCRGFNIEIKHTMQLADGSFEDDLVVSVELNDYIDAILNVVYKGAGNRPIVFSSFHPDSCLMLRLKQSRYPVLFLSQGEFSDHPAYADTRARSVTDAIQFVRSEGMMGVDLHSRELLQDLGVVRLAKKAGLAVYCWGVENNDRENMRVLEGAGVDAIILDRCNEFID
jgi:glycerophosphoryl diester phosphodiesterase